jgi:tetratricopeptide (TPR) repeat protein
MRPWRSPSAAAALLLAALLLGGAFPASAAPLSPAIGRVRNDTGRKDLAWLGEAVEYGLRRVLEAAAPVPPAPGTPLISGVLTRKGGAVRLTLSWEAADGTARRKELAVKTDDVPALLAAVEETLPALVDPSLRGVLRPGLPTGSHGALREFILAASAGDAADREAALRRALALDPLFHDARWRLAADLFAAGRYQEAAAEFGAYLAANPGSGPGLNNLGLALLKTGDRAGALERFRQAVALEGENVEARFNLARTLTDLGRLDEAAEAYGAIRAGKRGGMKATLELALVREIGGDHGRALELLGEVPRREVPPTVRYLHNLGMARWEEGSLAAARAAFLLALSLDPGDYPSRLAGGVLRYQEGDYQGALRELLLAEKTNPGDPDLHRYLSLVHQGLGQGAESAASLQKSRSLAQAAPGSEGRPAGERPVPAPAPVADTFSAEQREAVLHLRGRLEEASAAAARLEGEARALRESLRGREEERDALARERDALAARIAALEEEGRRANRDLGERDGVIARLEERIGTMTGERTTAAEELAALRSRTAELEGEKAALASARAQDRLLLARMEAEVARRDGEAQAQAGGGTASLTADLAECRAARDALTGELRSRQERAAVSQAEQDRLGVSLAECREQLAQEAVTRRRAAQEAGPGRDAVAVKAGEAERASHPELRSLRTLQEGVSAIAAESPEKTPPPAEGEVARLDARLRESERSLILVRRKLTDSERQLVQARAEREKALGQLADARSREAEVASRREAALAAERTHAADLAALRQERDALRTELDRREKELGSLRKEMADLWRRMVTNLRRTFGGSE